VLPLAAQLFRSQFGCLLVNRQPAAFFHRSGFRMEHFDSFSRFSSCTFERLPILKEIVAEYCYVISDAVDKSGYLYDHVGGQPLSPKLRRYYFIRRIL
jgi:hypothetical protein